MNITTQYLKNKIEEKSKDLINSKFYIAAHQGKINLNQIKYFINNVAYMVEHTPLCLSLAVNNSSNLKLIEFFKNKDKEEANHEEWAFDDLNQFGISDRKVSKKNVNRHLKILARYLLNLSFSHPAKYIIYMLAAEYSVVLTWPKLLDDLKTKCNIKPSQVSIASKHVEADQYHIIDDFKAIENFLNTDGLVSLGEAEKVINKSIYHIKKFYDDITSYADS